MKFLRLGIISMLVSFLLLPEKAWASHAMGADLSYQCVGNDSFLVTLNLYRDCAGIAAPANASVNISSASCGLSFNVTLSQVSFQEVSPLCPQQLAQSSCNNGPLPGVQQFVYESIITLPAQCSDWTISYNLCCRNDQITNLVTPGSYNLYVRATLNNTGGICDNSPLFTSLPVPYVCAGQQFNYNHGAIDIDGDSLVYTLINPLGGATTNVPYSGGFTPGNPFNTSSGFIFDTNTGQMTFTPTGQQTAVVTVLVSAYRNGVLIGSTMRDIQIVIIPCTNNQPTVSSIQNQVGGVQRDSVTIELCPDENVSFQFTATDPDAANTINMSSNATQAIPGSSFSVSGSGNTLIGNFSWTPTALDTGINVFTVTVTDNACPIFGSTVVSYQIFVLSGTSAGPDIRFCPAGGPVQLNAFGGNNFIWTPSAGLSDTTIRNPLAFPTVTTDYIVTSDLSSLCKNIDTVRVIVVPDFLLELEPFDTICRNSSTLLNAVADPSWAPFTYRWSPTSTLINTNGPTPTAFPFNTTTYSVTVTSDTGCTIIDSTTVYVIGVGPIVELSVDRNNVCPGDTVQLTSQIFPLDCGETLLSCSAQNLPVDKPYADSSPTSFTGTPLQGSQEDARYQALYLASNLNAAGIFAGTITRLQFEVGVKASTGVFQNLTIKMGCTGATSLSVGNGWENASVVVFGPSTISTNQGIINFPLSTPYDWDGRSNLVIEICFNNPSLASPGGNDQLLSEIVTYNASMRGNSNNADGCTLNPSFIYQRIPKTIFTICDPLISSYTFSWSPTTGLSNPNIPNPTAVVTELIDYTLFVSDNQCDGSALITLNIDDSYSIEAVPDTTICGNFVPIQLNVNVLGDPPKTTLPCGVNGTPCTSVPAVRQAGIGTSASNTGTPYKGFWEDGRVQFLYRAADLRAAGMITSGTISQVAFNVTNKASSAPYQGYTIRMGCTSANTLTSSGFLTAGMTTVMGPINYSTVFGWNTHTLTNPYDWDGTSNLVVEVCFNNPAFGWTGNDDVQITTTTGTTVLHVFTDGQAGCNLNFPSTSTGRPNARFTFCQAPVGTTSILWSPAGTLDNPAIANPIATPNVPTTYTVEYTFVNGCTLVDSLTVNFVTFNAEVSSPDTSICGGQSVQLGVSGGVLFDWDPIPGLSCYNCPDPVATPDSTTKYYVTISDATESCVVRDSVTVSIFSSPDISFSNDSILCFTGSYNLDAGAGFAGYNWNTGATSRSINITTAGTYSVTVTDLFGCFKSDSIDLVINNAPTVSLGNNQTTCAGDSITINAGSGFAAYAWSNGSTDTTIIVFTSGNYAVTVADTNNCPAFDTVQIIFSSPSVDLGPDVTLCAGQQLILIAGNSFNTYIWSTGTTDTFIVTSIPGIYSVTATDTIGCEDIDSLAFDYFPANPVNLGNDTTTCNNTLFVLDAGAGYADYFWSTGATSSSISTTQAGVFGVTVTDVNSCQYVDAITITDVTPIIDIGNDTTVCQGQSVTFSPGAGFQSYQWSNSATTPSVTVTTAAVYTVTVTDANNCTASDNARLVVNSLPLPDLGNGGDVCPGYILFPGSFAEYLWNDSSTDSILIADFSGTYTVTVTDANDCENDASVTLNVYELDLNLPDGLLCFPGDSFLLEVPADLVSYLWSNGSTGQNITVFESGTYSVTVVNAQGCVGIDESVVVYDSLAVVATADPIVVGPNGTTTLSANVMNGSGAYDFNWSPVETLDDPTSQFPVASPTTNTIYTVEITDLETECTATDTVLVIADSKFAIPDAFTPNGDGSNDRFELAFGGTVSVKEFRIYNRWGQLISEDVTGWDGSYKGQEQPSGTYSYYAVVELANGEIKTQSGVFSLLR